MVRDLEQKEGKRQVLFAGMRGDQEQPQIEDSCTYPPATPICFLNHSVAESPFDLALLTSSTVFLCAYPLGI